jgi:hypothetical protein
VITIGTTLRSRRFGQRIRLATAIGAACAVALAAPEFAAATTQTDTTSDNFYAGTLGANLHVSYAADGELILQPAMAEEFSSGARPLDWDGSGGPITYTDDRLHLRGGFLTTTATFAPGRSLEFIATFGAAAFQRAGFGAETPNTWAMFGTNAPQTSGQAIRVIAKTNLGGVSVDTPIGHFPNYYVGEQHVYRIDWEPGGVDFFVDGEMVATGASPAGPLTVGGYEVTGRGGPELSIDRMYLSPYASPGIFTSRVLGDARSSDWGALTWSGTAPPGSITMEVRTGNTNPPDSSWSLFTPITNGGDVPASSQYVQYRATLSTTNTDVTPVLSSVTIADQRPTGAGGVVGVSKKKNCKKIKSNKKRKKCRKHNRGASDAS